MEKVLPKIDRRINRFRDDIKNNNNNIFLWRYSNFSKEGCIELYNILTTRYIDINLKIIIIHWYNSNITDPKKDFYNLEYVNKYYFDISKNHTDQWTKIKDELNKKYNLN